MLLIVPDIQWTFVCRWCTSWHLFRVTGIRNRLCSAFSLWAWSQNSLGRCPLHPPPHRATSFPCEEPLPSIGPNQNTNLEEETVAIQQLERDTADPGRWVTQVRRGLSACPKERFYGFTYSMHTQRGDPLYTLWCCEESYAPRKYLDNVSHGTYEGLSFIFLCVYCFGHLWQSPGESIALTLQSTVMSPIVIL